MPACLLLDLGNRRLKTAFARAGACVDVQAHALPSPAGGTAHDAAWADLEGWLGERLARADGTVFASSTRPEAFARLRTGALAGAELRLAGEGGWPFAVATEGSGSDRILAARAAWHRAGGRRAVLVADLGSAWTLDVMDRAGTFRGGAIGAGLEAQAEALRRAAPHLPPALPSAASALPTDTDQAIAMGVFGAQAAALDGLAARFERTLDAGEAGTAVRFVTGGGAALLADWLDAAWTPAADLVLEGLAKLAAGDGGRA